MTTSSGLSRRGFGALGYTMHLPSEDRYLQTKTGLVWAGLLLGAGLIEQAGPDFGCRKTHSKTCRSNDGVDNREGREPTPAMWTSQHS